MFPDGLSDLTYDQVLADSILSGKSLLDTLVIDTFNMLKENLPTALQPDLLMDPADNEIAFIYPSAATDPFAGNYASDTTTAAIFAVTDATVTVPEPSTLALMTLGLLGLTSLARRQRQPWLRA